VHQLHHLHCYSPTTTKPEPGKNHELDPPARATEQRRTIKADIPSEILAYTPSEILAYTPFRPFIRS
jgi:hypothetical protein